MDYYNISSINSTCQHVVKELNKRYIMQCGHSFNARRFAAQYFLRLMSTSDGWIFKVSKQIGCRIKLKEFTKRHFFNQFSIKAVREKAWREQLPSDLDYFLFGFFKEWPFTKPLFRAEEYALKPNYALKPKNMLDDYKRSVLLFRRAAH